MMSVVLLLFVVMIFFIHRRPPHSPRASPPFPISTPSLARMLPAPCLDRGERAAKLPLRLGIGMRVNDLAVGRDDIARPAGDLARRRAVDRYLLADIDILARNDARPDRQSVV